MNITVIWTGFVILISILEELDKKHFVLFGGAMFYFMYLYNQVKPTSISSKSVLLLFNVPTLILWYIIFVYNDFLSINPVSHEVFMSWFFIYFYLMLYFLIVH
uniref:ORF102 n=1 Tax=Durinskia baltica diatom endosymbiont TaxID=1079368 RepID=I6N5M2_9STRA|nr:ORF102 [Durinskia baltica diatom endosymbiont]